MDNRRAGAIATATAQRLCQFRVFARLAACLLATVAAGSFASQASAADLKVVSGPAMARVLTDLTPRIEALTHRTLLIDVVPPNALTPRLSQGAPFDVAVVYEPDAISVLKSGRIAAGRLSCVGWTRLGLAAAPDSELPRIGNALQLKQVLLTARSIGYNGGDPSGLQFRSALTQLGLLEKIDAKLIDLGAGDPLEALAHGAVELAVSYVGDIASTKDVRSLGALAWQVQQLTPIFAGVSRDTTQREAAHRLIAFLTSFEAMAVLTAHDLDGTPNE